MDALKFIEERNRMCDYYRGGNELSECAKCPAPQRTCLSARSVTAEYIAAVEQWAQEHPRKTRQDAFLSLFPTGRLDKSGVLTICPAGVDAKLRGPDGTGCGINCDTCRREFWMQEVE